MPRNEQDPGSVGNQAFIDQLLNGLLKDDEPLDNNAEILPMPNRWLTVDERKSLGRKLFHFIRDELQIVRAGQSNQALMQHADAIVVDLGRSKGFLGDTVQESRLVGVLDQRYPEKVFVKSGYPSFFAKYKQVTGIDTNFFNLTLRYRENEDSPEQRIKPTGIFFVKPRVRGMACGELKTARKFRNPLKLHTEMSLDQVEDVHMQHVAQVIWGLLYGEAIETLPEPAIRVSEKDTGIARAVFNNLPVSSAFNIIIHPDAYKKTYPEKRWTTEKDVGIFVSRGVDHPEATDSIMQNVKPDPRVSFLPRLSLPQYAGLLDVFPKDKTVFVGLESMAASHLAPSLGLRSIALSDLQAFCLYYGPWNGLVVASTVNISKGSIAAINVGRVCQAVEMLR